MVSRTTVTIRTDSWICKGETYSSSKSLKQSLGGIWRCRITKTINKMSISAKRLYLLHCFFKRLTKNYIQSIPARKDQSFDPLSQ